MRISESDDCPDCYTKPTDSQKRATHTRKFKQKIFEGEGKGVGGWGVNATASSSSFLGGVFFSSTIL